MLAVVRLHMRLYAALLGWVRKPKPRGAFNPRRNPAVKLAVTVDADVHFKLIDAAEAEGKSVSALITDAARRALLVRDGLAAVVEWEAEHGALTPAELLAARARIEPKTSRRKRSPR